MRGNKKREKAAGWGATRPRVVGRRNAAMGGRVGLGHRGRGTLTPAGSPLPFPYTAAPASPGPAPASVGRAADRSEHRVSVAHNGLLSPPTPAKSAKSRLFTYRNAQLCLYRGPRAHTHTHTGSHTQGHTLRRFVLERV